MLQKCNIKSVDNMKTNGDMCDLESYCLGIIGALLLRLKSCQTTAIFIKPLRHGLEEFNFPNPVAS